MADLEITEDRVRQVAKLASLALTDEEVTHLRADLSSILGYVALLDEVSVDGVEPTCQPVPLDCPLRADVVQPGLTQAEALRMAPRAEAGGFAVPKVLDGEG